MYKSVVPQVRAVSYMINWPDIPINNQSYDQLTWYPQKNQVPCYRVEIPNSDRIKLFISTVGLIKHFINHSGCGTSMDYNVTLNRLLFPEADENCLTDCICPCGWVNPPKNYTPEELAAVVLEIQKKLAVTKSLLSSTVI